jgi:PAS domain S-box-containing protein
LVHDDTEDLAAENARLREELRSLKARLSNSPVGSPSSEQVYQSIFRLSPSNITVTRFEDGTYYDVNDTFCRTIDVSRERALTESSLSLNLWVDRSARDKIKSLLKRDGAYTNVEIDYYTAGGVVLHMLQSAELVTIGDARYIIGVSTDITDRKQAEATLARERERLSVTLQSLSDGVLAVDADRRVEILNRVAAGFLGVAPTSALGQPVEGLLRLLDGTSREPVTDVFGTLLEDLDRTSPFVLVAKDGTERMVVVDGAPIATPEGRTGTVLVLRDVTVQLQMEEHLRKASRLESLGILAGGIAHDFNNVLMGIKSNITFARTRDAEEQERQEALEDVEAAVRHARDLTQQLLTFSRGGTPIRSNASVRELVEEVTGFALRGSAIGFELDLAQDLSAAEVDRSQISQVIENLVVNAAQAMAEGGSLRVTGDNTVVGDDSPLPLSAGRYVRISVEDTGPGIADLDLPRIFDPFFSKRPGGTGLGLSIVHSVVKRHDGCVQVQSQVGKGTRFDVYLPASDKAYERRHIGSSTPRFGNERILVMDDDAMVRRSLQRLLKQLGYRVEVVPDGNSAVEVFERALAQSTPFALVFLDLTVPGGTGGKDAARKLRQLSSTTPIVVSSGYSNDTVMANPQAYGFDACIAKPHQAEELRQVLDALLGEAQPD